MDRQVERFRRFQESGERMLPPPSILDLDPIIPPYVKWGQAGHLYVVKPPGHEEPLFKVGSTTQLLKRMYWYEPGMELLFCVYISEGLRSMEQDWIKSLKKDPRFRLVQGREYFTGAWSEAIKLLKVPGGDTSGAPPLHPAAF
jgi:hypothetical protein